MNEPTQIRTNDVASFRTIPSIEDHLNLSDWTFKATFEQGQHGDYYWISLDYDVEYEKIISYPQDQYRVLVTHYDGFGKAAFCYGNTPGWRTIGECAISDFVTDRSPEINYAADTALMFLTKQVTDQELLSDLKFADEEPDPNNSRFWLLLERMQPYLFVSYMEKEFFASKNKALLDALRSPNALADVEERERSYRKMSRLTKWENVGPECGPEQCVEPDCHRLRIERAIRCYMHQLRAFGEGT
jgi:hypothetical protein